MNDLHDLICADAVRVGAHVASKKQLLTMLADLAGDVWGLDRHHVHDRLAERERLGSTGFGQGIAIPHAKCDGLDRVTVACVRLAQPVDYGAIDGAPVDLVMLLLSPSDGGAEHLKALARVSLVLRDKQLVAKLRGAGDAAALYALFTAESPRDAA